MNRAINLLLSAFIEVQQDAELLLDYDFMIPIFEPLYERLPEFEPT